MTLKKVDKFFNKKEEIQDSEFFAWIDMSPELIFHPSPGKILGF